MFLTLIDLHKSSLRRRRRRRRLSRRSCRTEEETSVREQEDQEEQEQEELQRKNSFPDLDDEDFLPEVDQRCVITPPSTVPRSFGRLENQLKKPELTCISEEVTPHRHCHCCHFNHHHHRESPTWSCLTTFWTSSKYWRTSPAVTRCSGASGGQARSEANTHCCVILVIITTYHHHTTTTSTTRWRTT